jgi:hypothetical protein
MRGAYEAMFNVSTDGSGEEDRFLRHETDLRSEPLHIQFANVDAVQAHTATERIIKPLDQRDDGRLARSRSTHESCRLACRERKAEVLKDVNLWACRVIEVNILNSNFADDRARLEAFFTAGINRGNQIDSGKEPCSCSTTIGNGYHVLI